MLTVCFPYFEDDVAVLRATSQILKVVSRIHFCFPDCEGCILTSRVLELCVTFDQIILLVDVGN